MKPKQSKAEKALDKEIERLYYRHANGVQVNIMDIPKIFAFCQKWHADGKDLETGVIEAIAQFRQDH